MPTRRHLLRAALAAPAFLTLTRVARAQPDGMPPVLFAHGNGDSSALWLTTLWRFESNGVARDRLLAFDFTDPLARAEDDKPQPNRSGTEDQRRELADAVATLRARTGAERVAVVASSRGGYAVRNHIRSGGRDLSHAVLCGVPNHGVYDLPDNLMGEFNGRGPFLRRLNEGAVEADPGVAWLTLRSDGQDKFAQPDGRHVGRPGQATGITSDGPALTGATNLVLGPLDHREVAFGSRAFRESFRFIAGREPDRVAIAPERQVTLDGRVTTTPGGAPTNRPLAGAGVSDWRVAPDTGERIGAVLRETVTGVDGRWGPVEVESIWALEFVLKAAGYPTAHVYRSPFPRSSSLVHLRPPRVLAPADREAGAVVQLTRPRGYLGLPRDVVLLDGREPKDVAPGVPTDATTTLRLPAGEAGRAVAAVFNEERIVARAWPASENRITIAEMTG